MPPKESNPPNNNQIPEGQIAADLIRDKVARIYAEEPSVQQEIAEAKTVPHRSKHQEFMYKLSTSGKDLAAIQTEWHNYYQNLPADERHQVWHEFYASQSSAINPQATPHQVSAHKHEASTPAKKPRKQPDNRKPDQIKAAIKHKITAGGKLETKHHIQSLLFGLMMGVAVLVIFLFSFFNEIVIAPFIQPSRTSAATPLIVSSDSAIASSEPQVIIPKINVQIPTDFTVKSTDEKKIETALDTGVVHYPTTVMPGELGNTAFFGHSSNNIFNKGKYKFAFVLLHTLVPGDTFYLTNNGKTYVYKVVSKKVVSPNEVGVLDPVPGYAATATLITCDPPGTSINRLVVVGEQISPDPAGNTASTVPTDKLTSLPGESLPGNGPTLWGRVTESFLGKLAVAAILSIVTLLIIIRTARAFSRG